MTFQIFPAGADPGKILTTAQIDSSDKIIVFVILKPKLEERKNTRPDNLYTARAGVAVAWIRPCAEKRS